MTSSSISGGANGGVEYLLLTAYGIVIIALLGCGLWNLLQQHRPTTTNVSILPGQHHVMDLWTEHGLMWTCSVCGHDNMCPERTPPPLPYFRGGQQQHDPSTLCLMCGSPSRPGSASVQTAPSPTSTTPQMLSAHRKDWTRRITSLSPSKSSGPPVEVWEATPQAALVGTMGESHLPIVGYIAVCVPSPTHTSGRMVPQTTTEFNAMALVNATASLNRAGGTAAASLRYAQLPFPRKYHLWLTQVAQVKERYRHRLVYIRTTRQAATVVTATVSRLMALSPDELHYPLNIRFAGEPGVDAGGLEREWYNVVTTALFDPHNGYFVEVEHASKSMLIHPNASPKFVDVSIYRSLKWLQSQQLPTTYHTSTPATTVDALELDFSVLETDLDERGDPIGTSYVVDLKPHGRHIRVTNANVAEYVELYVHRLCLTRVSPCVAALRHGLQDVLPPSMLLLDMMDHKELELLLCGNVDVADWKKYCYVIASKAAVNPIEIVKWFWDTVASMPRERQVKLLQYVTGSVCVPLHGFQALTNRDGSICHFTLRIVSLEEATYPVAHTCSNRYIFEELGSSGLAGVPSRPNPVDVDSSPGVGLKDDNITPNIEEVEFEVSFVEGKIGLSLEVIHPNVVRVKDTSGAARACNIIEIGDVLVRVQGVDIAAHRFAHVMHTLKSAPRPLTVRFRRPVRTVELPPHFQLDRDLDQPFEYRHRGGPQDADSVRACHEESDNDSTDGARLLLRWQPCVGAETYYLQQSRDWPVKVWKQCNVTAAAAVINKTLSDGNEDDVANSRTLREGIVQGLDFNKSYVFRIRCGLHSGAWGDFSDASDPVTTPLPTMTSVHYPGAATLGTTAAAAPTDVTLGYHADFEGDANAMSLVVTAWSAPLATMASEDDLIDAKDALARKEAALAVVAHLKDMANSIKGLYQASVK
ncbi:hypothetical protein DYB26_006303 [Aphanomyces astaci]|uniref:HECT-type E3 ubiquitin transferase n=1 Tax=Aphanomyces astaci TaxID=112090 RepID=A0A3R6YEE6_APHAT|nr:hypothetical protein DYB26_006303 [Aphanomyces astaci]